MSSERFIGYSQQITPRTAPAHALERRRIIGALRERTIFIQNEIPTPNIANQQNHQPRAITSATDDQIEIKTIVSRINEHVNNILQAQESSLEDRLYNIDAQTQRNQVLQEELENRLIKIQRQLIAFKQQRSSQTPQYASQHSQVFESYSSTPKPTRTYPTFLK